MISFAGIFVVLYNLNLFLSFYLEIMLQLNVIFNYKNTVLYSTNFNFYDILLYIFYKQNNTIKYLLKNIV